MTESCQTLLKKHRSDYRDFSKGHCLVLSVLEGPFLILGIKIEVLTFGSYFESIPLAF